MSYTIKTVCALISICTLIFAPAASALVPTAFIPIAPVVQTVDTSEIHIKFRSDVTPLLQNNSFRSQSDQDLTKLNSLLSISGTSKKERLFTPSPASIEQKREKIKQQKGVSAPDLNSYFRIKLSKKAAATTLLNSIKQLPYVAEAYFAPLPAAAPTDFATQQTYREDAPRGLGVNSVAGLVGSLGDNVQVTDIEYSWNTEHEDLSDARQTDTLIANGTPYDPFNDTNHGTAVAGILNADHNSVGTNGIVPNSKLRFVNAYAAERGWDVANAILLAQANSAPGDVILIEQQAFGVGSEYVPVEWVPAAYDAIKLATDSGIIVIEAAGNGGRNLDDPVYGTNFPQGKPDSGAIMVGAGAISCNAGPSGQAHRVRNATSNYGSRVNVQSWGSNVATTGYPTGTMTANTAYTTGFSGTSSASALVAGVAAAASSHEEATTGLHLSSSELRNLFISTGNPQDNRQNPGHIGPSPNLPRALGQPATSLSTPCLVATANDGPVVDLSWDDTIDNLDAEIVIWRNGQMIDTVTGTAVYTDESVQIGTNYSYAVSVRNAVGETSALSNVVSVYTADVVPPTTPANFVVTGKQASSITLGWTASSDVYGVAGYDVFRNGVKVATTTALTYTNTGLTPNTAYSFYLVAFDSAGNRSIATNTITSTTLADTQAPTAPTNLTGNGAVVGKVTLQWSAASDNYGVTAYNVYRAGVLIGTSTTTTFVDTTVARKKSYTYQVKAVDASGNLSPFSNSVTVKAS